MPPASRMASRVAARPAPAPAFAPIKAAPIAPKPFVRGGLALNPVQPVITRSGPIPASAFKLKTEMQPRVKPVLPVTPRTKDPFGPSNAAPTESPTPEPAAPTEPERYVQPTASASAGQSEGQSEQSEESDEREEEPEQAREIQDDYAQGYRGEADEGESVEEANGGDSYESDYEEEGSYDDDPDSYDDIFEGEVPAVSTHVHNGHMHTAALAFTPGGCSLVTTRVRCPDADQEGIVEFGADNPDWVLRGLSRTAEVIREKVKTLDSKKEIGSIVRRARAGDQNAMGIIAMVRSRAQAGDEVAKRSSRAMHDYIRDNPPTGEMGSELKPGLEDKSKLRACLCLANGPLLTKRKIQEFIASFGNEQHAKTFLYGILRFRPTAALAKVEKALDELSRQILDAGRTVGKARAIQMVRMPNSKISKFDPVIGWELGE